MTDECVFCKIIDGDIPSHKVYEDEDMIAFLDANPVSRGHTLVVPKQHVENIHQASNMEFMWKGVTKVADAVREAFDPEGINIAQNNGEAAGQEVFHLHFHVTPVYTGQEIEIKYDRSDLKDGDQVAGRISEKIE